MSSEPHIGRPPDWKTVAEVVEGKYLDMVAERNALQERVKRLEEALESVLVADEDGILHAPECIGIYGYKCKAWCADTRDALSGSEVKP